MDELTNQDCIEEADDEISSESESDYDNESDNESFVISNYEWMPESASDEESEEEEFDLLKMMDRETVHESPLSSPPTTPAPNPGSPPPALPPPSTPFDMIDYLMAGPKKEVQLRHCPTCTCIKHCFVLETNKAGSMKNEFRISYLFPSFKSLVFRTGSSRQ